MSMTAAALMIALSACARSDAGNLNEEADDPPPTSAEEAAAERTDTLYIAALEAPDGGDPGVGGMVVLLTEGDAAPVTLTIEALGLPPGNHAWHIHQGACGSSGPVQIPLSSTADMEGITGPLEVSDEGDADAEVELDALPRSAVGAGQHSLHIHVEEGIDHGPTIACATI